MVINYFCSTHVWPYTPIRIFIKKVYDYAHKTIDIYFAVFPKELNNIIYKDHNGNTLVSIRFWLQASISDYQW